MAVLALLAYLPLLWSAQGIPCENGKCSALEGPQLLQTNSLLQTSSASSVKQRIGATEAPTAAPGATPATPATATLKEMAQILCDEAVKRGKEASVVVTDAQGAMLGWASNAATEAGSSSLKYNPQETLKEKALKSAKHFIQHWGSEPGKTIDVDSVNEYTDFEGKEQGKEHDTHWAREVLVRADVNCNGNACQGSSQGLLPHGKPDGRKPLAKCAGDCDGDFDCASGLKCYKRHLDSEPMPFCQGIPYKDKDYCYEVERLVDVTNIPVIVISVGGVEGVMAFGSVIWQGFSAKSSDHYKEADLIGAAKELGFVRKDHTGATSWRTTTWELPNR